jgi:hypothetical protein
MKGVTKVMGQMNRKMNLPQISKIMMDFERQNETMGEAALGGWGSGRDGVGGQGGCGVGRPVVDFERQNETMREAQRGAEGGRRHDWKMKEQSVPARVHIVSGLLLVTWWGLQVSVEAGCLL